MLGQSRQQSFQSEPICNLFLTHALVKMFSPENSKIAFISPVYRKGAVKICENYRPISTIPMFAKLFERILLNQFNEFIQKEKIFLNSTQFVFKNISLLQMLFYV